jgi:GGDEF domain-containing protein
LAKWHGFSSAGVWKAHPRAAARHPAAGHQALHFAERLRERIERRFTSDGLLGITASHGFADFSADTSAPRALIEAAGAAMHESKHAWPEPGGAQPEASVWP